MTHHDIATPPRYTPLDLALADKGDQLSEPFAVVDLSYGVTRAGDPMLRVRLANDRGQKIGATVFGDTIPRWRDIRVGDPVMITARVGEYRGTKQLEIVGVARLDKPHRVLDAMNEVCPPERYEAALAGFERHLRAVRHPGYRLFLQRFFETVCPEEDFLTCPAAKGNHHAYVGGLLEHSVEVTDFAVLGATLSYADAGADLDLLRTACLLHDAGKLWEYVWKGVPIGMAPLERLYNHLVTGPIMTWMCFRTFRDELEAAGFTERDALEIMHVQASHHGKLAWGSPVTPKTPEAHLAHAADQQSAQLRKMAEAIARHPADEYGRILGSPAFRFGLMAEPAGSRVAEPAWASYELLCAVSPASTMPSSGAPMPPGPGVIACTGSTVGARPPAIDAVGHRSDATDPVPNDGHDRAGDGTDGAFAETSPAATSDGPAVATPTLPGLCARTSVEFHLQRDAIRHEGYRRFVDLVFTEACPEGEFLACPLLVPIADGPESPEPHGVGYGLAQHTLAVTQLAAASASSPGTRAVAHLDLARAAALLHAVGTVRAVTRATKEPPVTAAGRLLPSIVLGPLMLHETFHGHRAELEALGFTIYDLHHLVHVQVSYPGTLENGAASTPATLTAQLVQSASALATARASIAR